MANAPYFQSSIPDHKRALAAIDSAIRGHRPTELLLLRALELDSDALSAALDPLTTGVDAQHVDQFLVGAEGLREVLQARINLIDEAIERLSIVALHIIENRTSSASWRSATELA